MKYSGAGSWQFVVNDNESGRVWHSWARLHCLQPEPTHWPSKGSGAKYARTRILRWLNSVSPNDRNRFRGQRSAVRSRRGLPHRQRCMWSAGAQHAKSTGQCRSSAILTRDSEDCEDPAAAGRHEMWPNSVDNTTLDSILQTRMRERKVGNDSPRGISIREDLGSGKIRPPIIKPR
jgi:hypothetical protein